MNQGKSGTHWETTLGVIGGSYNNRILSHCYQEDPFKLDWNIDNAGSENIRNRGYHICCVCSRTYEGNL